jgi:hypothetical protein
MALQYASDELKDDDEIVKEAMQNNKEARQFASTRLKAVNGGSITKDTDSDKEEKEKQQVATRGGKNSRRAASIAYSLKKRSERKKKAKKATIKSR